MKATANRTLLTIEANWADGDIEKVQTVSQWLQDNRGYQLIDGCDDPEEYYETLGHPNTTREAVEDYRDAKRATE